MISASSLACRSPRASLRALVFAPSSPSISSPKRFSCSSKPTLLAASIKSVNLRPDRLSPNCSLRSDRSFSYMDDASNSGARSVHDFAVKDAHGNDVELSKYKGKVLLIVNVASKCGLTNSNYPELTELYTKYKSQGLEILAFPCNQFGSQEPGTNNEIVDFVCARFKAEFPVFGKVDVNGDNAAPLYKFLKSSKGGIFGDGIKWNFTKFLVDQNGNAVDRYAPTTSPSSIEKDVKKLLVVA